MDVSLHVCWPEDVSDRLGHVFFYVTDDVHRIARATGAKVQTTVYGLTPDVLGTCGFFEERQVGAERYNLFRECKESRTATIILRGGAEQFIDESERSIHGAC